MPRKMGYPRNEASRRDNIVQHEIIIGTARNHKSRNNSIAANPHGNAALSIALTGTVISGGVLESEIVTGSETLIITLAGDTWQPALGSDNALTTAFLAAITGDDAGSNGFDDEITLVHGNLVRTSDTIMTLTIPAGASYAVAADETVTVAPPVGSVTRGIAPASQTFDITADVTITLAGTMVAGGVLESEIVSGGVAATLTITLVGDTWVATAGDDNAITTAILAGLVGDLADAAGWNVQVSATLAHADLTRTSGTVLTLVGPAVAAYAITTGNETVTVSIPVSALTGGIVPVDKAFVITEGS